MAETRTAIGLMSGTSLDGLDAAVIRTDGEQRVERLKTHTIPFDEAFKARLMAMARNEAPLTELLRLERQFTEKASEAVAEVMQNLDATPDVIGFHGQTLRHLPEEGLTFQMGDSSLLAHRTQLPVVADFRRRDMAAGGEGAPFASYYHRAILANHKGPHVVLTLGGVANVTALFPDGSTLAGDVGPGNGLLDVWMQKYFDKPFDENGATALAGQVDTAWIEATLQKDSYFALPLPKSADRYQFDACWPDHLNATDGAATLAALTTAASASAINALGLSAPQIWLTGGGVKNNAMVRHLEKKFTNVKPIDDIGVSADFLEAECFAWLAVRRLRGLPTSGPGTTGAETETTGGVLTA